MNPYNNDRVKKGIQKVARLIQYKEKSVVPKALLTITMGGKERKGEYGYPQHHGYHQQYYGGFPAHGGKGAVVEQLQEYKDINDITNAMEMAQEQERQKKNVETDFQKQSDVALAVTKALRGDEGEKEEKGEKNDGQIEKVIGEAAEIRRMVTENTKNIGGITELGKKKTVRTSKTRRWYRRAMKKYSLI